MSPRCSGLVGSPSRQWSKVSPRAAAHFRSFGGAVDRDALLVAGDQERDRALRLAAGGGEMVEHRGKPAGDRALHVDGAAAVQHAVSDVGAERRVLPVRLVARRHHVGVAGEHEMRLAGADAGVEVLDIVGAGLGEGDAVDGKARARQRRFEIAPAPRLPPASPTDSAGDHGQRRWDRRTWRAQSRSSSLMLVLDRVFSSTRLTMTAQ